ncbi:MAG: hypothetical protein HQL16_00680 [Candidatus Omnitrophica bacterium]|nr:hypothetical protein [Candidatus Omnitrophota bacterium]
MIKKVFSLFLLGNFFLSSVLPNSAYAQALTLPTPGTMLATSEAYVPLIFKGLQVQPKNPMLFDFIVDTGDTGLKAGKDDAAIRTESQKLIKYFLASLTLPEQDQWVNLSPYEHDRMMPVELEKTELGRDMLAQDYVLKQVTASLIYPEKDLGKQFWSKVYSQVQEKFGNAEIPMDTFNKVWVVADKADVYVNNNTAFVVGSHLKVMLESDYLAAQKADTTTATGSQEYTKQIVREIILPALENEVNTGKNFANLRQIFHAMILATWYKKNLKEALLNQVYSNKGKTNGVTLGATNVDPQAIYSKYVEAYKKGAFNLIKEDVLANGETVPRKYFSGGEAPNLGADKAMRLVGKEAAGNFSMKDAVRVQAGVEKSVPTEESLGTVAVKDAAMKYPSVLNKDMGFDKSRQKIMDAFNNAINQAGPKSEDKRDWDGRIQAMNFDVTDLLNKELNTYIARLPDSEQLNQFVIGLLTDLFNLHNQREKEGDAEGAHFVYGFLHTLSARIVGVYTGSDGEIRVSAWVGEGGIKERVAWPLFSQIIASDIIKDKRKINTYMVSRDQLAETMARDITGLGLTLKADVDFIQVWFTNDSQPQDMISIKAWDKGFPESVESLMKLISLTEDKTGKKASTVWLNFSTSGSGKAMEANRSNTVRLTYNIADAAMKTFSQMWTLFSVQRQIQNRHDDKNPLAWKSVYGKENHFFDTVENASEIELKNAIQRLMGQKNFALPFLDTIVKASDAEVLGTFITAMQQSQQFAWAAGFVEDIANEKMKQKSAVEAVAGSKFDPKTFEPYDEITAILWRLFSLWHQKEASEDGTKDAAQATLPPGGIDMNAQKMQMNEKGQKIDITFDPATVEQFKRGDFTGLKPVIFNITPIANPLLLLGLNQEAAAQNS